MNVAGNLITDAVLIIKNGASSASSVGVSNPATGQTFVWSNTLAANAWLRLSSDSQRAEVSVDSGGNWTKSNANVTGVIPKLQGGVNNAVEITGPTTGTFEYTYTARFF